MAVADSPTHERIELKGRQPVSRTTIQGWPSFLFGLPFAAVGVVVLMLWSGKVAISPSKVHAPLWILEIFGFFFLMAGLSFIWHGLDGVRRKAKIKNAKAIRASSPWLWDYEWQAMGISENKMKEVFRTLLIAVVFAVFMAPFHWFVLFSEEGKLAPIWVKGVLGLFDLVILALIAKFFYLLVQYFKYGNSRLRFGNFPFYLGDKMSVVLLGMPSRVNQMIIDLRFIEEQYETRGSGKNRRQEVVCYQLYHENRTLTGSQIFSANTMPMEWDLPNEADLTTALSQRPARFWELEVRADTPGVDYHSRFLLPVYAGGL